MSEVGLNIRLLCIGKGIGTRELSEMSGVSRNSIHKSISGRAKPQKQTLEKFAKALGTTPEEILSLNIDEKVIEIYKEAEIGDKIKLLCINKGITVRELGKRAEVNYSVICSVVENRKRPTDRTLRKVVAALNDIPRDVFSSALDDEAKKLCRERNIGNKIKLLCAEKGMNLTDLQRKSNLPYDTVFRVVNNISNPSTITLKAIANALDMTVGDILYGDLDDAMVYNYDPKEIQKRLCQIFLEKEMTRIELAKRAGVSESTVGNMMMQKTQLKIQTLEKIARALWTTVRKVAESIEQ